MICFTDIEAHDARNAEARRRIAVAAAMSESVTNHSEGEAAAIFEGCRAFLWLAGGMDRHASAPFIADLCRQFGIVVVLRASSDLCKAQPPGPRAWLKRTCQRIGTTEASAIRQATSAATAGNPRSTPCDNAAFRTLFMLPPIRQSASSTLMVPEMPPQTVVTGDNEVDAVLWLQTVVDTGSQSLIDKAIEAIKRIKTPMKQLADRYAAYIMRNGGHTMRAVFATIGFGELEGRAKGAIERAARRHEALSHFGAVEALFGDTPAETACKEALDGMEQLKSLHYAFDAAEAAKRFQAKPDLAPATLADCLHGQAYWDSLYRLRNAFEGCGDPDSSGQAHDDYCFAALACIPPRTTTEALAVLDYLQVMEHLNRAEAGAILRNLVSGPHQ